VIPDIKLRSPKEGELIGDRRPEQYALALVNAGAPAVSVVTEPKHFGGSLSLLESVVRAVEGRAPVLRKDFIQTADEIAASREAGASAVLLIAAQLDQSLLVELVAAAGECGIETVVEVHDAEELERVRTIAYDVLGVNNRDIVNLELDHGTIATSEALAEMIPDGAVWISESGIHTPEEARRAVDVGATGVLVGTELLKADDPVRRWRELSGIAED